LVAAFFGSRRISVTLAVAGLVRINALPVALVHPVVSFRKALLAALLGSFRHRALILAGLVQFDAFSVALVELFLELAFSVAEQVEFPAFSLAGFGVGLAGTAAEVVRVATRTDGVV
jgi:hypothetical protein